jgi:phosphoenolpyruvate carboxylase
VPLFETIGDLRRAAIMREFYALPGIARWWCAAAASRT